MPNSQSIKASARYIRISAHKTRRVLNQIRGRSFKEALMVLEFLPYRANEPIKQLIYSAANNAKHNYALDENELVIASIFADEGPKLKRVQPRAQGRACQILKPTCHITVVLKKN